MWRDQIAVHPAADVFPLLADDDLAALSEDIKRKAGLVSPITILVENDQPILLDGRNRLDAMERLGWQLEIKKGRGRRGDWYLLIVGDQDAGDLEEGEGYPAETLSYDNAVAVYNGADPAEYVASANIHRRHLTSEAKRNLIAELLKDNPKRSDRATAELVKVDHKTVGAVRRQEESVGSIPHFEKRVDTKGRHQPAAKPKPRRNKRGDDAGLDDNCTALLAVAKETTPTAQVAKIGETAEQKAKASERTPPNKADVQAVNTVMREVQSLVIGCEGKVPGLLLDGDATQSLMNVLHLASESFRRLAESVATHPPQKGIMPDVPPFLDRRNAAFKNATPAVGAIKRLAEFCQTNSPVSLAAGTLPHEVAGMRDAIAKIDAWLGRFVVALDDVTTKE